MPPHCDSVDGPVALAAIQALDSDDVSLVLPFVHKEGEAEVLTAFERSMRARKTGGDARQVSDQWFLETVVRIHRAGEGAGFTGLKPAGLDVGPVIPLAEQVIRMGNPTLLIDFLVRTLSDEVQKRFDHLVAARRIADHEKSVDAEREYAEAMLGLQVWSHRLYKRMLAAPHAKE